MIPGPASERAGADRGAGTVWAAGAIAVLMGVGLFGLQLGGAILTRHHAESAADLAALGGAAHLAAGERAGCAQARRVTDRMRVRLVSCQGRGEDLLVQVAVRPGGLLGDLSDATAQARAGPVLSRPEVIRPRDIVRLDQDTTDPDGCRGLGVIHTVPAIHILIMSCSR